MRKHRKSAAKLLLATIVLTATMGLTAQAEENPEIKAAVERATQAGAGSYQDSYISGGWKSETTWTGATLSYLRASKDPNGMIVSPTSGVVMKASTSGDRLSAGSDKSISVSPDPANGNLQPNWVYNPLGKTMDAPAVICMDKNTYELIGWQLTGSDNNGNPTCRMDTCDTSGSWVYNPNPTGSAERFGRTGQLAGWMYRYADGTYAANGTVYIYDDSATWDESMNNLEGSFILSQAYYFNENGFLVTNTPHDATYVDEYGRVCDGTAGPYGIRWNYTD